jgi:hypothetical protein
VTTVRRTTDQVEIAPFMRLTPGRTLLLTAIVIAAGIAGAAYGATQPLRYTAETTVFLDRVFRLARFELEPKVANYAVLARQTDARQAIVDELGLSAIDVAANLTTERPDGTTTVVVRFRNASPGIAEAAAQSAARTGLREVAERDVAAAERALARSSATSM